jgi:hypothetical protein
MTDDQTVPPTVYELSKMADVGDPDHSESPGGEWLTYIYESWENVRTQYDDVDRMITETADGSVPVGTHQRWLVYVDVCGYREDLTDYDLDPKDMNAICSLCLYVIAERLIAALEFDARKDES